MNTGLQKWETTKKMRSANYPTPAELDAYAKKIANNPLTIQIFPNSVKVPQRKHIRRTVNGLDTSSSSQRLSPYPSQVSGRAGLLAVLRAPAKGFARDSDGGRVRLLQKAIMNPHNGAYAAQSTLNLPQLGSSLQGSPLPQALAAQKQLMLQTPQQQHNIAHLQQSQAMPHPHALQQRSVARSQAALQQQQSMGPQQQQIMAHPPGMQRQHGLPHPQTLQQQGLPCPPQHRQAAQHHQQALLQQPGMTQDLRHVPDAGPLPSLQHSHGLVGSQPAPQAAGAGPSDTPSGPQQPLPIAFGPRKPPDADAPPNITVSTSTIPLSMAASLHQNRPSDLSSIVHQINQFCQARAGMGATSVCEGQIANPSPISRNLLINASSRVSTHNLAPGSMGGPACLMTGPPDKAQGPTGALNPQSSMAAMNNMAAYHAETGKLQLQQLQLQLQQQKQQQSHQHPQQSHQHPQHPAQSHQHSLQPHQHPPQSHQHPPQSQQQQLHLQQQQRSWAQHQLAHMQQPHEGAHPCKNPRREPPSEPGFPSRNLSYPHKLPGAAQSFPLKHPPEKPQSSSPVSGPTASVRYTNGHYVQPSWVGLPATGSGPQEFPGPFQGLPPGASSECTPGAKYRPGKAGPGGQPKLMQGVDFGDLQMPSYHEQGLELVDKMQRPPPIGQVQEPSNGRGVHSHHTGYR